MRRPQRVAILGAGAAGLSAVRSLCKSFDVVAYEAAEYVGGIWVYDPRTDMDEPETGRQRNVHSSMYKSLHTNLPKDVMAFPGFPFKPDLPSFPGHHDVADYIRDFALKYNLERYIRFGRTITHVEPLDSSDRWTGYRVVSEDREGNTETSIFDAVVVCNGHYSRPRMPMIPGAEEFPGLIMHSHNYREPDLLKNKKVVVLGAGASGVDISIELAKVTDVVWSFRGADSTPQANASNPTRRPPLERLDKNRNVFFEDGSVEGDVDAVLFCTGYEYSFEFLSQSCGIEIRENTVQDLYKHLVSIHRPTLAFVGLVWKIAPFPLFYSQTEFLSAVWEGRVPLPTESELKQELDEDKRMRDKLGIPARYGHMLGQMQWEYSRRLCDASKSDPSIEPVVQHMYYDAGIARRADPQNYRRRQYQKLSDTDFAVTLDGVDVTPPH